MDHTPQRVKETNATSLVGQTIAERYEVRECLSTSDTSTVYRAWREEMRREVALKVLSQPKDGAGDVMAQVRAEVNATSRLSHPNTVTIFATGLLDDGRTFLVMELLEGGKTLRELMDAQVMLPTKRSLTILRQIAAAVGEAHRNDVFHCNLKPDNIYISERAGLHDFVTVLDFGMALVLPGRRTGVHAVVSSEQYRAPELERRETGAGAADVYAIGCIAYEMLSGAPPLRKPDAPYNSVPSFPPHVLYRVPNYVRSLVRRMLSHHPEERPRDAVELSRLLSADGAREDRTAAWTSPGQATAAAPRPPQPAIRLGSISDTFPTVGRPHAEKPMAQGRTTLPSGQVAFVSVHHKTGTSIDISLLGGDSVKVGDVLVISLPLSAKGAAFIRGRITKRQQLRVGGPVDALFELADTPDGRWLLTALAAHHPSTV